MQPLQGIHMAALHPQWLHACGGGLHAKPGWCCKQGGNATQESCNKLKLGSPQLQQFLCSLTSPYEVDQLGTPLLGHCNELQGKAGKGLACQQHRLHVS